MASNVSLYLRDDVLRKLDSAVERCAAEEKAHGLSGRQVTNRSRLVERIIEEHLGHEPSLSIEEIQYQVVSLAKEYGAKKVTLFGSFAQGTNTETSDIDLLLDKGAIKGVRVLDFQDELACRLNRPVDVVTTAGASERFLNKIQSGQVVLYEAV